MKNNNKKKKKITKKRKKRSISAILERRVHAVRNSKRLKKEIGTRERGKTMIFSDIKKERNIQ